MAKYFKTAHRLIPQGGGNAVIEVAIEDGEWRGLIDLEVVREFQNEDSATYWLNKIADKLIEGGDTILIIDDF